MSMVRGRAICSGSQGRTGDRSGERMFVPLYDHNPLDRIRFQYVTIALIFVNVLVFLLQIGMPMSDDTLGSLAVIPEKLATWFASITGGGALTPTPGALVVSNAPLTQFMTAPFTLITYMFLHGSWVHLGGNMLFLWVFGDNVEDAMGHVRFLIFYLLCGIFAGIVHVTATHLLMPANAQGQIAGMIGASGAVAGVIAAYLMLHPRVRIWVLVFFRIPVRVSAGIALVIWALLQVYSAYEAYARGDNGGTAWWAHIGGLAMGAILIVFMRQPGFELFDRATGLEPDGSARSPTGIGGPP
jgi:membrane associated rhomboid family serine protease